MQFIGGAERGQMIMLPDCVDDYVSGNNPVRVIDAYINSLDLKALDFTKAEPNDTGRPMYSSQDLLKLYVYGYMNRVRSSRRLETECKRNLEVIWLMRKLSPDHKTIARFRQDNPRALKNVFRDFVKLCLKLGLYGKELVAIDSSKFKAVNSKDRNFTEQKLKERIKRLDRKIEEYLRQMEEQDNRDAAAETVNSPEQITQIISELTQRKDIYQAYTAELKQSNQAQKSLTDQDSRLMMANGKLDVCYNVQTSVDSRNKMVVDFEVTNDPQDKNHLSGLAGQSAEILETKQLDVTTDAGYDSATDIAKCISRGIIPHVAGADFEICLPADVAPEEPITSHANGRCIYLADRNIVLCPMGAVLYPRFFKASAKTTVFHNRAACKECICKCTVERYRRFEINMQPSKFTREYNDKDLMVRQIKVRPNKEIVKLRKAIAEHPYGTLKRGMNAGYCLTKGIRNVSGEFSLAFLVYNLKRAINIMGVNKLLEAVQA